MSMKMERLYQLIRLVRLSEIHVQKLGDDERRGSVGLVLLIKNSTNELHKIWVSDFSQESLHFLNVDCDSKSLDGHPHCSLQHLPPSSSANPPANDHFVRRNFPHLCVVCCQLFRLAFSSL